MPLWHSALDYCDYTESVKQVYLIQWYGTINISFKLQWSINSQSIAGQCEKTTESINQQCNGIDWQDSAAMLLYCAATAGHYVISSDTREKHQQSSRRFLNWLCMMVAYCCVLTVYRSEALVSMHSKYVFRTVRLLLQCSYFPLQHLLFAPWKKNDSSFLFNFPPSVKAQQIIAIQWGAICCLENGFRIESWRHSTALINATSHQQQ